MKLYLAPMEGLTGHVFRQTYHRHFRDFDRYFTPFIATNDKLNFKTLREINPVTNAGLDLIPQLMTNRVEDTLTLTDDLKEHGYNHININLGCPSGTVVSKKRGSGFLSVPDELLIFFDELFEKADVPVSVKTRIGVNDVNEWPSLVEVFSRFPFSEIIIHPRLRAWQYEGIPDVEAFAYAYERLKSPIVYNGDVYTVEDYLRLTERFPDMEAVMIGRGIIRDPFLLEKITEGDKYRSENERERLSSFIRELESEYAKYMPTDRALLFRMKETWLYLSHYFSDYEKVVKEVKKSQNMKEYHYMLLTLGL